MKKKTMVTAIKDFAVLEKKRVAQQVPQPALKTAAPPARSKPRKRRALKSSPPSATAKGGGTHVEFDPYRDLPEK